MLLSKFNLHLSSAEKRVAEEKADREATEKRRLARLEKKEAEERARQERLRKEEVCSILCLHLFLLH